VRGNNDVGDDDRAGKRLQRAENVKRKSDNYLNFMPMLSSSSCVLLHNERMIDQIASLKRDALPSGLERIGAPQGQHDDLSDCVAGVMKIVNEEKAYNTWMAPVTRYDGKRCTFVEGMTDGFREATLQLYGHYGNFH
jgi:hypothetical protein